jgi:soluble lytic murein transglycosylase-like protein
LKDADYALDWTARHLSTFPRYCKGFICLSRYNGGAYEVKVWRLVDLMHRGVLKIEPKVALEPTSGSKG